MTMLALPWLREDKNKVTPKMIDFSNTFGALGTNRDIIECSFTGISKILDGFGSQW